MTQTAEPSPDLRALLDQARASGREESQYDFKLEAKDNTTLLRHIVAMSNLPAETPGGRAYLFIGVMDDRRVIGLKPQDLVSNATADKRETFLNDFMRNDVDPDFTVRVYELQVGEAQLHIVEIPCLGWPWRQLHRRNEGQQGFWIRHGPNSVLAKRDQLAAQWGQVERRLQDQIVALESALATQHQHLNDLRQLPLGSPLNPGSSVQAAQVGFTTPERTLLRLVRQDISTYLQAHAASVDSWQTLPHYQLDRLDSHTAHDVNQEIAAQVRSAVEQQEAVVRPLVELVAAIMHDADPTDRVKTAMKEVAQAVAFTSHTVVGATNVTYAALRYYPGYLLCFGSCAAALTVPDWTILGIILQHVQPITFPSGAGGRWNLIQSIGLRPHLDALVLTFDRQFPRAAAAERARELFHQADWLGAYLPATLKSRITRHAEVLLLLAYVAQARKATSRAPFVDGAWLQYPVAQDTLREALRMIGNRWDKVHDTPLNVLVQQFDDLAGTHQWPYVVTAEGALSEVRVLRGLAAQ